eukprot:scaffold9712_cov32-Tisochrysis_lutea.AAC.1
MMNATENELSLCPGLGPTKVRRLIDAFNEPFIPKYARTAQAREQRVLAAAPDEGDAPSDS